MKIRTGIASLALAVAAAAAALFSNPPPAEAQNSKGGGYNTPSRVVQASQLTPTTGTGSVVLSTSPTLVTPTLGAANATSVNFGGNALNAYTVGTFTATVATGLTTTPTFTMKYTLIGNIVILEWGQASGTSNATTMTVTGLPAALQPNATKVTTGIRVQDNGGAEVFGMANFSAGSGTISIYKDANGTNWTSSGTKAIDFGTSIYTLQ